MFSGDIKVEQQLKKGNRIWHTVALTQMNRPKGADFTKENTRGIKVDTMNVYTSSGAKHVLDYKRHRDNGWRLFYTAIQLIVAEDGVTTRVSPYSDPVYFDVTADSATEDGGITLIEVTRSNMPQKGIIRITKTGEVFWTVTEADEIYNPVYAVKSLPGAVFEIRAAEDIYTLDGVMHYAKGEIVDTITTESDGVAASKELYLG